MEAWGSLSKLWKQVDYNGMLLLSLTFHLTLKIALTKLCFPFYKILKIFVEVVENGAYGMTGIPSIQ